MPDYVGFTDWAEDAYVALTDDGEGGSYLMEPWEFLRAGDALIADAVEEHSEVRSSQAPLIFQGGNCLIGSHFWLLGKDYFADTLQLLNGPRPPVAIPDGASPEEFVRALFSEYLDSKRGLLVLGTNKPVPVRDYYGSREGNRFFLDVAGEGTGTYQPIFHIDMFVTLIGPAHALVGDPRLSDSILGRRSPFALPEVYDSIAADLTAAGLTVERNPLVHQPTLGRKMAFGELANLAQQPGNAALATAVKELAAAEAGDATQVQI